MKRLLVTATVVTSSLVLAGPAHAAVVKAGEPRPVICVSSGGDCCFGGKALQR